MRLTTDINNLISIGIFVGAFLIGLGISIYRKYKNKNRRRDPLCSLERDLLIQDVLTELRVNIGADRVYVCKFHNGGEYFDGLKIKKISRTHESCGRGVSHESVSYQNIPLSMIPEVMMIIQQSVKTDAPVIRCVKSLNNGFLKNHFENLGVKIFLKYKLNIGLKLVGYMGIQFVDKDKELSNEEISKIKEAAGRIENILATTELE